MPGPQNYTVESKEEIRKLSRAGEVLTYYRVWATTKKGTYFHIECPEAELARAPELLEAKARQLDAI